MEPKFHIIQSVETYKRNKVFDKVKKGHNQLRKTNNRDTKYSATRAEVKFNVHFIAIIISNSTFKVNVFSVSNIECA